MASTATHRDTDPASVAAGAAHTAPECALRHDDPGRDRTAGLRVSPLRHRDRTVDLNPDHWEWQKAARCRGEDFTIFFGADRERGRAQNEREARAKRICAECTVIAECRHYATVHQEPFGVWGGLSERERRRTLRYT